MSGHSDLQMPKSRAQQPNRKPPAGAPSKGFQSSFVEPLNAPQSKRARIHPTEHSARNHPWSDLGSSFTPRQSPGYTDNNPTAPKQTPLSRLNPTPTLPNNSNTWPDAPSSSTKANSQTQHSQWPMTALPKPALSSSLSVLHPDLVEHPTSPLQSGKHRDRRPAFVMQRLNLYVLKLIRSDSGAELTFANWQPKSSSGNKRNGPSGPTLSLAPWHLHNPTMTKFSRHRPCNSSSMLPNCASHRFSHHRLLTRSSFAPLSFRPIPNTHQPLHLAAASLFWSSIAQRDQSLSSFSRIPLIQSSLNVDLNTVSRPASCPPSGMTKMPFRSAMKSGSWTGWMFCFVRITTRGLC